MNPKPTVSFIVVSFNTEKLLRECLRSIETYEPEAETIVVDNQSKDGSVAMVRDEFPRAKLILSSENGGFAWANNLGIEASTSDYVVLFNSDAYLEDDSVSRCVAWLEAHPEFGAVSPLLYGVDGESQECFYLLPSFVEYLRISLRRPHTVITDDEADNAWLVGAAVVVRRTALKSIGDRLDDGYFMYWEDADLSIRLRRAGWRISRRSDCHVRHYGGGSGGGDNLDRPPLLQSWWVYGRYRWFARWRPPYETLALMLLDVVNILRTFLRGLIKPDRPRHWRQARIAAAMLARAVVQRPPYRPGGSPRRAAS